MIDINNFLILKIRNIKLFWVYILEQHFRQVEPNILYKNKFNVIDTDEYVIKDIDSTVLFERNKQIFDYTIYNFLIDNYFDEFVNSYRLLKEMYNDKESNVIIFIELLRKYLSEYIGDEVNKLNDAKECMNKRKILEPFYIRDIKMK